MTERPHTERRRWPRPPLWLNLLLLIIAAAGFLGARHQREQINRRTATLLAPIPHTSEELERLRDQLSDMDMTEAELGRELDAKLDYLHMIQSNQFYLSIDTAKGKLYLRIGNDVAREADIQVGAAKTITSGGRTWTFVPLKGAFSVTGKSNDYDWPVPEWVYGMNHEAPVSGRVVHDGLGHYVISLPDNYCIHSPPPADSPLHGQPKPGSIMVPEADLAAIWPRITNETRVYIF